VRSGRTVLNTAIVAVAAFTAGLILSPDDGNDGPATTTTDTASTAPVARPVTVSSVPVADLERVDPNDPEVGTRDGSPLDDLPDNVSSLTDFGQRPDWSPDGSKIVFLDASPLGNVWTVDVGTKQTRNVTGSLGESLYSRAYYLSNGDLLLCGPTSGPQPTPEHPEAGRFTGVMSVLRAPFDQTPLPLGLPCWEGMATSRTSMRIAWNRSDIDYTDSDLVGRVVNGITEIWTGEIRVVDGRPVVVDAHKVLDRDTFGSLAVFEVQGFRPPSDDELILTAYAYQSGEVIGLDTVTGELRNYSNSTAYEEAEGVDATGSAVYVERDLEYGGIEPGPLDIWRLDLDTHTWERVTYFNRYAPYYASNPTVAPDGSQLAFQLSIDGDTEGQGDGILLLELPQHERAR
jgi:hypothetical protein